MRCGVRAEPIAHVLRLADVLPHVCPWQRSYNIGMDAKGQGLLREIGAWDRVSPHCAEVVGRVDWMPGGDTPQEVDFLEKFGYAIQVIQRDCLTALLREEIEDKYLDRIRLAYNTECKSITWGTRPGDPVRLELQETRRIHPKGEVRGARPTVEPVGPPIEVVADFVVGADGANSRVRDAMEADAKPEEVGPPAAPCARFRITSARAELQVLPLSLPSPSHAPSLAALDAAGIQGGEVSGSEQARLQDHFSQRAGGREDQRRLQRRVARGHHH